MNMRQRVSGLQVVCRVTRPSYTFRQCDQVLSCPAGDFAFDRVLGADDRQLFVTIGLKAIAELLEGRSTLICALDQTKSSSLLGSSVQPGLIWRVVKELEDLRPRLSCLVCSGDASTEVLELQMRSGEEALQIVERVDWPDGHRLLLLRTETAIIGFLESFESPWSLLQQCLSLLPGRKPESYLAASLQTPLPLSVTLLCTVNPQRAASSRFLQLLSALVPLSPVLSLRSGSVERSQRKQDLELAHHQVRRFQKQLGAALARVQALEQAREAKERVARQSLITDMTQALEAMESAYCHSQALLVDTYEDLLCGLERCTTYRDMATQCGISTREAGTGPETKPGKRPPPSGKLKRSC